MAIQHRRGNESDFVAGKMLPGELAVTTDGSKKAWIAFGAGDVKEFAFQDDIPLKISEIENDEEFIKNTVTDLKNYYLKSETYTQEEINQLISVLPKYSVVVVDSLPLVGDFEKIYLLKAGDEEGNLFDEYIYVNSKWERIGSQRIDLSNYVTKQEAEKLSKDVNTQVTELKSNLSELPTKEEVYKLEPCVYEQVFGYYSSSVNFVEGIIEWGARIWRVVARKGDKFRISRQVDQKVCIVYLNDSKEIVDHEKKEIGVYETFDITIPNNEQIAYVDFYIQNISREDISTRLYKYVKDTSYPSIAKTFVDCKEEFSFSQNNVRQDPYKAIGTYTKSLGLHVASITPTEDTYYHIKGKSRFSILAIMDNTTIESHVADNDTPEDFEMYVYCSANHRLSVNIEYGYEQVFEKFAEITEDKFGETKVYEKTVSVDVVSGNVQASGCIFIASSDATANEKAAANYVCDGVADEDEINAAITTIPANGGKIQLSSGTFHLSSPIIINKRVSIFGMGASVGSRPKYDPTNGNTWNETFGNAGQFGATTIRIDADCDGIQVTTFVRGLTLKDFFLQGYGKDRHSYAGIHIMNSTDVLMIDGINISDCKICFYAPNSQDAPCIVNSGFEWCGCGMYISGGYAKLANLIFCDNNGLDTYDGIDLHCGGLYARLGGSTITGCQILRSNKYEGGTEMPTHLLVLAGAANSVVGNVLQVASGCGIYGIGASACTITGNTIGNFGSRNVADMNDGIYLDNSTESGTITGNFIGLTFGTDTLKAQYPFRKAVKHTCTYGTGIVCTGNVANYPMDNDAFTSARVTSVIANNLVQPR